MAATAAFDAVHAPHPNGSLMLSVRVLKLESGEFDLESVQSLFFADIGLQGLELIGKHCPNIRTLELHNCGLIELRALSSCTSLKKLVLVNNKIQSLDGLRFMEKLEELYLQDNFIASPDQLAELARLHRLEALFLRNLDKTMPNPICQLDNYKTEVRAVLPKLVCLDGERWFIKRPPSSGDDGAAAADVGGEASSSSASGDGVSSSSSAQRQQVVRGNFYAACDELDAQIAAKRAEVEKDLLEALNKPWVEDDFFQVDSVNDDAYRDSIKKAEGELTELKQLNSASLALIQKITQRITG